MTIQPQDVGRVLKDVGPVLKAISQKIESPDPQVRHDGYTKLQHDAEFLHGRMPKETVRRFLTAFFKETDKVLRDTAFKALMTLSLMPPNDPGEDPPPPPTKSLKEHLGHWLFEPFQQKSAVISVYDAEKYRRDESAEVYLGRRLSYDLNPATEFIHFSATDPRAHLVLPNQSFKAVCVVGRPGLFGEELFLPLIRYPLIPGGDVGAAEAFRFGFDVHHRSPDVPHNQIDPAYHYLVERKGDESIEHLRTVDDGHRRRDYGLVQRYSVKLGGRTTVIVVIAGASSLGTLGAARWATHSLFQATIDPKGEDSAFPIPISAKQEGRLEALVEITADSTQGAWESPNVELLHLSLGAESWLQAENRWLPTAPYEVTLVYRENNAVRILFDRRPHAFGNQSKPFVLTKELAESAAQGRSQWTLDELRANKAAWGQKETDGLIGSESAADQLRILRTRHLGTALAIDGDQITWRCKVRRLDET